ncbi:MAG: XdhC family protein [Lachnospiraceae bacterium]|nr:XdhC family protein [Lachnospiraceae bacterium]
MNLFLDRLQSLPEGGENLVFTLLEGEEAGEKAIFSEGELLLCSGEESFFSSFRGEALGSTENGIIIMGGKRVFAERLGGEPKVVICGAGHVSIPIIRLSKMLGLKVTCIDDREEFAYNARETEADTVICEDFSTALKNLKSDAYTYYIIVTRSHEWDIDCLRAISEKSFAYVGMMGSARRVAVVKEKLLEEGLPERFILSLHAPIGLPIGAETPDEIAVSILSEIIEVKNRTGKTYGYPGEFLKTLSALQSDGSDDKSCVLATIVSKKGSAPRRIGTKMLILPKRKMVGSIGGGRAEAIVLEKARELLKNKDGKPVLLDIDLSGEDAANQGMVCGGVLEVFLEPLF